MSQTELQFSPFQSLLPLGALLLTLLGGTVSLEAQTIYGPGGLLLNPTADLPAKGKITSAALVIPEKRDGAPGHLTWTAYTVDYGASEDLEVGLTHLKVSPGSPAQFDKGSTGLYAKYRLLPAKPGQPVQVAVGGGFLAGGDADGANVYATVRYSPLKASNPRQLRLHTGAIYIDKQDNIKRSRVVPFVGADYALAQDWTLFAEARASMPVRSNNADGTHVPRAAGVIYQPGQNFKLVLAYATNGWNSSGPRFSIGIGYGLGGGR